MFMSGFRRLTIITTLATFFLIFLGGLVRVSGAGLGCPDWPKCFGSWIPPLSAMHLPPEIDPATFNLTLAWIEYVNRLAGVMVGLLIVAVALRAIIQYRKHLGILIPSLIVAPLTAFQGWQGSMVVSSELEPIIVSVHMVIAFVIVSLLIYISQQAYYVENKNAPRDSVYPSGVRKWVGILWLLAISQVVLGTQFREAIERAVNVYPLITHAEMFGLIGAIKHFHPAFALVVLFVTVFVVWKLLRQSKQISSIVWQSAWCMLGLMGIEILLGTAMIFWDLQAVMQVMHLWLACLLAGVVFITLVDLRQKRGTA